MNRPSRTILAVVLALSLAPAQRAFAQEEWPGFRGADGQGVASAGIDFDTLAPEVMWRVEVGSGYSGLAVVDNRVLTMVEEADGQFMLALDADTGAELWRQRLADRHPGHDGSWDGPISSPVVHDGVVVGLEPWGRIVALDVVDGEPMWSLHLVDDLGATLPSYGFGSSPTVIDGMVILNGGGEAGTVVALDLRTGEVRWTVGDESVDFQSPVRMELGGREMLVAVGGQHVFGIDPATGSVEWQYAHGGGGPRGAGTMVPLDIGDDRIFLTHSGDSGQVMALSSADGALTGSQVWEARTIRSTYVPAVYHDGYLYGYNLRIFSCVDATTGELMWRSREPGDGFPMVLDGRLLVLTKDGTLHIAHATPEGYQEIVGLPVLEELTWTQPSVAYGDVFARSQTEIVRVDLNGGGSRAVETADLKVPRSLDPGDGEFGRFIRAVEASDDPDSLIDDFFAGNPEIPVREGATRVHFVYRGQGTDVAITGDLLGTRQDVVMVRVGDTDLYYYSTELVPGSRVSYAFLIDGTFTLDSRNPLQVSTLIYNAEREHVFGDRPLRMSELRTPDWRLPAHLREPTGARGTVERITKERRNGEFDFQVYLPPGYSGTDARYPVVYFRGPAPTAISMIPTALDNLIASGMQPVIAVWTDVQLGAGPRTMEFWRDETVAVIDDRYRTIASREGRVLVGGGLGALAALEAAVNYPDMVSGLALLSIRALDVQWDPLVPMFGTPDTHPRRIYVEWGVYGLRNPQEVWDNRMKSAERAQQFRDLGYDVRGGEVRDGVGWASWRNRLDAILQAILPPAGPQ